MGGPDAVLVVDVPGNRGTTAVIQTGLQNSTISTVESASDL